MNSDLIEREWARSRGDTLRSPAADWSGAAAAPDACELTILMPCLNEAETVATCVDKARDFLEHHRVRGEVLVGDNGSTDGSPELARRHGARVVHVPVRGYGAAIHHATLAARGKYVVMADSDDSYDFTHLEPFLEALRAGYDLVMGDRFAGGIEPGAMPWKNRWLGTPILSGIGRLFFGSPVRDFNCGLRGFSRQAYDQLNLRTTGMEFASEMIIKATLLGLRIAEVPTTLRQAGRSRPPHLRPLRDGWRHLVFMLLYSPRWLFLYPGLALVASGILLLTWLWSGQQRVGPVVLDVHTMLYAALLVLIGFQAVAFAMFSKVFATSEGLLPHDPRLHTWLRHVTLEVGVVSGAVLIAVGLIGTGYAVYDWSLRDFGQLDPARTLRVVIPSGLALTLGIQLVFSSFFLSLLSLRVRHLWQSSEPICGGPPPAVRRPRGARAAARLRRRVKSKSM